METPVHHLNCATMRPFSTRLVNGTGGVLSRGYGVCHCLLIETDDGLALVDTGFGLRDVTAPTLLVRVFTALIGVPRDPEETAARQVIRMGYGPEDVRHIVLTHLHLDHAGGLSDFPGAKIHLLAEEYEAAMHPRTLSERFYVAEHWAHGPRWVTHSPQGERWFGFDGAPMVEKGSPDVLLIPLPGHTRGHCGVAVRTSDGWLLHCGDAYGYRGQVDPVREHCPPLGGVIEQVAGVDHGAGQRTKTRLRALVRDHGDEVRLFCSHDPVEFRTYADRR